MKPLAIYTWGYEGRTVADLRAETQKVGPCQIVDVRRGNTGARVKKGWSWLDLHREFGYLYWSFNFLGNWGKTSVWERGPRATRDLFMVAASMVGMPTTMFLLCKERDHAACHRTEVAAALVAILAAAGVECEVRHLGEEVTGA